MTYLKRDHTCRNFFYFLLLFGSFTLLAGAATVRGAVADSLGAVIPNARVELMSGSTSIASVIADGAGRDGFHGMSRGRYKTRANAPSFCWPTSPPFYSGEVANANVE